MSMDWANERFIRFFTRDTVTWKRWTWEAKAAWGLLLRKVDRAGVIDTGSHEKTDAMALILEVPCEVATRVLPEWLKSGALVESEVGYLVPRFLEAQETPISDKQRQVESRANRRAASLRSSEVVCHAVSHGVTPSHTVSLQTRPDQSRPDQTIKIAPSKTAPPKATRAPDPRHATVVADFDRAYRTKHSRNYPFAKADFRRITELLARTSGPQELLEAWQRALANTGFPTIATIEEFGKHLPRFLGTGPPTKPGVLAQPSSSWNTTPATTVTESL